MRRWLPIALLATSLAAQERPRRILYVTHSAGFRHSCLELSQQVLREIATRTGRLEVIATEDLSLITAQRLRDFDALFFYTSGELALSIQQKADLLEFVRSGKGFGGAHSATDTLYTWPEYGELIGGVFDGHPWAQEASIDVEDASHPISRHLAPSWRLVEEFYQFRSFSRDKVRVLMTLDTRTADPRAQGVNRTDDDFALAWVHRYGAGRVFYTALGHFEDTWRDPRFQEVISNGLLWIAGLIDGDASVPPRGPVQVALPEVIAPGAVLEVYGENLTTGSTITANPFDWKYRLAGTRLRVNGSASPIYYASPDQLNVQFPFDLEPGSNAEITVSVGEKTFSVGFARVAPSAPVIRGVIPQAGVLQIFVTGLGALNSGIVTGAVAPFDRLIPTRETPRVRIAGRETAIEFSGLAPGWVGLYQVNAVIPADLPVGVIEVELGLGGRTARWLWARP